jgi:hypothetical protein
MLTVIKTCHSVLVAYLTCIYWFMPILAIYFCTVLHEDFRVFNESLTKTASSGNIRCIGHCRRHHQTICNLVSHIDTMFSPYFETILAVCLIQICFFLCIVLWDAQVAANSFLVVIFTFYLLGVLIVLIAVCCACAKLNTMVCILKCYLHLIHVFDYNVSNIEIFYNNICASNLYSLICHKYC